MKTRINQYLKDHLTEKRYQHTLGVVSIAKLLGNIHNLQVEKLELAALLHDSAKWMKKSKLIEIISNEGVPISSIEKESSGLLHAKAGVINAKTLFNIQDENILSAIESHTTGKPGMNDIEKVIFIADYLDPNRNIPEQNTILEIAKKDLNIAVFEIVKAKTIYVMSKNKIIHPLSIETYNYYLSCWNINNSY